MAIIFGAETVLAGVLGVAAGSFLGQKLRRRYPSADPLVCAIGLLFSAPLMLGTLMMADGPPAITFTVMFFGQWFLNLNWSLVADITLVNKQIVLVTFWCHGGVSLRNVIRRHLCWLHCLSPD